MDIFTLKTLKATKPKLNNKRVVIIGDSIAAGNGWAGGYANIIAEQNPSAIITNLAVQGTKITGGGIFGQITDYYVAHAEDRSYDPDLIIICGGGNDFINRETIGTLNMDSTYPAGDSETFANALETMFYSTKTVYPYAKIVYMTLPMMQQWDDGSTVPGVPVASVQKSYWDVARNACEKWCIPVCDLFKDGGITSANASQLGSFYLTNDTIHFNENGYRVTYPVLKSIVDKIFQKV